VTDDPLDGPEQRVHQLLRELGEDRPPGAEGLPARVVRSARWQHAVRGSLVASSELAVVAGIALRLALGSGRQR
jgi:hypothetical protein